MRKQVPDGLRAIIAQQCAERAEDERGAVWLCKVAMIAIGAFGVWLGVQDVSRCTTSSCAGEALFKLAVATLVLLLIPGTILWFARTTEKRRRDVDRAPILEFLRDPPAEIAWIYPETRTGYYVVIPLPSEEVVELALVTGLRVDFILPKGRTQEVLAHLAEMFPRATIGFSPQHEREYCRSPASLLAP